MTIICLWADLTLKKPKSGKLELRETGIKADGQCNQFQFYIYIYSHSHILSHCPFGLLAWVHHKKENLKANLCRVTNILQSFNPHSGSNRISNPCTPVCPQRRTSSIPTIPELYHCLNKPHDNIII